VHEEQASLFGIAMANLVQLDGRLNAIDVDLRERRRFLAWIGAGGRLEGTVADIVRRLCFALERRADVCMKRCEPANPRLLWRTA